MAALLADAPEVGQVLRDGLVRLPRHVSEWEAGRRRLMIPGAWLLEQHGLNTVQALLGPPRAEEADEDGTIPLTKG